MANEKRLIDANAFVECLERMTKTAYPNLFPGLLEAIDFAKDFITVDAVEVVHAHWAPHNMVPGFVQCSACRDCITYDEWPDGQKWKYCPNCGAKMDEKEALENGGE